MLASCAPEEFEGFVRFYGRLAHRPEDVASFQGQLLEAGIDAERAEAIIALLESIWRSRSH